MKKLFCCILIVVFFTPMLSGCGTIRGALSSLMSDDNERYCNEYYDEHYDDYCNDYCDDYCDDYYYEFQPVTLTPEQIFAYNVDAVFKILTQHGIGSGFFICPTGVALTNHHVMVTWLQAVIVTESGEPFEIIGWYSYCLNNDIAIIRVDGRGNEFHYLTIGDSDALVVGEDVFTIGSPHGQQNTFSRSYISQFVPLLSIGGGEIIYTIADTIQITAPIYPGSSGGAMLNRYGHVVGITTAVDPMRANVATVVPISRADLSVVETANLFPLPIGITERTPEFTYTSFAFIPTFVSVTQYAVFLTGGTVDSFNDPNSMFSIYYDYFFIYHLSYVHSISSIFAYGTALMELGFVLQEEHTPDDLTFRMIFFYHPEQNVSLFIGYTREFAMAQIAIGRGDVFTRMSGDFGVSPPTSGIGAPPKNPPMRRP